MRKRDVIVNIDKKISQIHVLNEVGNLLADETGQRWHVLFGNEQEKRAGAHIEIEKVGEGFPSTEGQGRWAVAFIDAASQDVSHWSEEIRRVCVAGKMPADVEHMAVISPALGTRSISLYDEAKQLLDKVGMTIVFDNVFGTLPSLSLYDDESTSFSAYFKGEKALLLLEENTFYASRFDMEARAKVVLRFICAAFAHARGKHTPCNKDIAVACATLKTISFGKLSLPEECFHLDIEDLSDVPEELLRLTCAEPPSSLAGKLFVIFKVGSSLLTAWLEMLLMHGLNMFGGENYPETGMISAAVVELAKTLPGFEEAATAFAAHPGDSERENLTWTYAVLMDMDGPALRSERESSSRKVMETLSDFVVYNDELALDVAKKRYNIQSTALDHIVAGIRQVSINEARCDKECEGAVILLRDGYNAVSCPISDIYTFSNMEFSHSGQWAVALLNPIQQLFLSPEAIGYALIAIGAVPASTKKLAVIATDWTKVDPELVYDIAAELERSRIDVIADASGMISIDAMGAKELAGLFDEVLVYDPADGCVIPHPCFSKNVEDRSPFLGKLSQAYGYIQAQRELAQIYQDMEGHDPAQLPSALSFLSLGRAQSDTCEKLLEVPATLMFEMGPKGREFKFGIANLLRPNCSVMPRSEWAGALDELRDLCFIWENCIDGAGPLQVVPGFPLTQSRKAAARVGKVMGVEKMVEAYYKGVPMEDMLSARSLKKYSQVVGA